MKERIGNSPMPEFESTSDHADYYIRVSQRKEIDLKPNDSGEIYSDDNLQKKISRRNIIQSIPIIGIGGLIFFLMGGFKASNKGVESVENISLKSPSINATRREFLRRMLIRQ